MERQGFQCAVGYGGILGDVLVRSLHGYLAAMLHKVVSSQLPDIIAEIDREADTAQKCHLKDAQSFNNGSQSRHSSHHAKRHPERTEATAERDTLMSETGDSYSHDPDEQRRNHGKSHQIESVEHLKHQFGSLRTADTAAPRVPAKAQQGIEKLPAGIGRKKNMGRSGKFSGHTFSYCCDPTILM